MNDNDYRSDCALTQELRDCLYDLATPERPPLGAITTMGRTHQRRRLAGIAGGLGATGVAAGAALALGLTGVLGAAPAQSASTIRTTAFTLTMNANGTATLKLNINVLLEPGTLQTDLQHDGIPALVTTGSFCSSDPSPAGFNQVTGGPKSPPGSPPVFTINRAAMPAGTELSFGFFQLANVGGTGNPGEETAISLIDANSYTCASIPPANGYGVMVAHIPGGPK